MFDKLKNKMQALQKIAEEKAVEKLLVDKVHPDVQLERISICRSCEKFYKVTAQCRLCGCFMNVKSWMPDQRCPVNKWVQAEKHSVGIIED